MARDPLDRFYTPKWCVDQCMAEVLPHYFRVWRPSLIVEPSAGKGVFVSSLRERFPNAQIAASDIDPDVGPWGGADDSYESDFFETDWEALFRAYGYKEEKPVGLTIGNPPYKYAVEFCEECLRWSEHLVFILRTDFLNSAARAKFFKEHEPSHVFLLPNRPSFTEDGATGEYDYAWVCWSPKPKAQRTQLLWLPEVPVSIRRPK